MQVTAKGSAAEVQRSSEQDTYPNALLEHQPGQTMCSSRDKARWTTDESLIHNSDLEEVLCERPRLKIVIVGLADPPQEAHWSRPAKFELQHAEHETFRLENLVASVAAINHVYNLLHGRAIDLFVLGGDEYCSGADQLQLSQGDDLARQEAVDVVDTEIERFWEKIEAMVHLNYPVHQYCTHRPLYLCLVVHIVRIWQHLDLLYTVSMIQVPAYLH